jgi:ABC-type uncharacterized transport system involved in gliding motility auxiliary subunit
MRAGLFFLPFLSFFLALISLASYASFEKMPEIALGIAGLAVAVFVGWLVAERQAIRQVFTRKGARSGVSSGVSVILGFAIIVGLAFLSNRPRFNYTWDVTSQKLNTLSDQSRKLIDKMDSESIAIEAVAFFLEGDEQSTLNKQKFQDLIVLYQGEGADIEVDYVDPQEDPRRVVAENVTQADTVILKRGDQDTRLTTFTEEKLTNALLRLLKPSSKTIVFIQGHGERSLDNSEAEGLAMAKAELESERYAVDTLNLLEQKDVPEKADLLVIAGPKYDFHDQELAALQSYLAAGRPLLVMVDALVGLPKLNRFLQDYGLSFGQDLILNPTLASTGQPLLQYSALVTEFDEMSPLTNDFASQGNVHLILPYARSVMVHEDNAQNMTVKSVAEGAYANVRYQGVSRPEDMRGVKDDQITDGDVSLIAYAHGQTGGSELAASSQSATASEQSQDAQPSTATKPSRELRLVAAGSSHLASNAGITTAANVDMFLNIISYLVQDEDFIAIRPKNPEASRLELVSAKSQFGLFFLAYVYPFVFLGAGFVHWLKRRRT